MNKWDKEKQRKIILKNIMEKNKERWEKEKKE